jgi:hypothetical protein
MMKPPALSLGCWSMKVLGQLMRAFVAVAAWDLRNGCHSSHRVRNCKRRRLVHESIHAELKVADGAEGAFGIGPPACIPLVHAELNMCDGAEGAFNTGPPTCIPNIGYMFLVYHMHE